MNRAFLINWIGLPYAPTPQALAAALPSSDVTGELKKLRSDYRFRVVREFDDLLEKIFIFEAGLDDRVIEWEKQLFLRICSEEQAGKAPKAPGPDLEFIKPRFKRCVEKDGKRTMEFIGPTVMIMPGLGRLPLSLSGPDTMYQRATQHLDKHLPWPEPVSGDFLLVDENYILRAWPNLPDIEEPGAT